MPGDCDVALAYPQQGNEQVGRVAQAGMYAPSTGKAALVTNAVSSLANAVGRANHQPVE
jgi:hypothetical protein